MVELKQLVCILMVLHNVIYKVTVTPWPVHPQGHWSEMLKAWLSPVHSAVPCHTTPSEAVSTLLFMDEKSTHVKCASHVEFCFSQ